MDLLDIALYNLDDDPFEEKPADLKEYLYEDTYLGLTKQGIVLSDEQELLVDLMSQVYKKKDLIRLFGRDRGEEIWSHTKQEIIMMLGKGAGKDFTSTIGCSYLVHKLLCLRDPAKYFGKPAGDAIDIINIAINAQQANNVFFKGFVNKIENSPWFAGKYQKKMGQVAFDKGITVHSGHSERESWEGYNVILVILDEIAGFAIESTSGNENSKTAEAVYQMYAASVTSRFPDVGKIVELSFPRYEGDFITKRYNKVIKEKETILREHTFKINPDLPDGLYENEFTIEWEEDHIIHYDIPNVFAMRRPSWEVNAARDISEYMRAFLEDPVDALGRFACMPPKAVDAFFRSQERVEAAFAREDEALDEMGRLRSDFLPMEGMDYFIHVDLAQKHDRCVISMAHVAGWGAVPGASRGVEPLIRVDLIKYWTPKSDQPLNLDEVFDFILGISRQGFKLRLVTFDRWNSTQTIEDLRSYGLRAEILSVALPHYTDFLIAVNDGRVDGPYDQILIDEMLQLRIMKNNKIDHPRRGGKDLADAVCGAVYNAAKHSVRSDGAIIEVRSYATIVKENREEDSAAAARAQAISPPKAKEDAKMPQELRDYLSGIRLI